MNQITIKNKKFELFLGSEVIQNKVSELAKVLSDDLKDKNPVFLGILNGSFIFAADLLRQLSFDARITFLKLASYHGTKSIGDIRQLIGVNENLTNENVVILEDIVDTGFTIEHIINQISGYKPASVKIVTLLFKSAAYKKNIQPDYIGFTIPDDFVVGYGLDYEGFGRNYKDIYKIKG